MKKHKQLFVILVVVLLFFVTIYNLQQQQTLQQHAAPPPSGSPTTPEGQTGNWSLIFDDEFDGTAVDTSKWSFVSSAESNCDAQGCSNPGNQQLEYNWGNNCSVAGGILTITAKREQHGSSAWTSCMLHSNPQFQTMYMEARVKLPPDKGFWPGFWTWNGPQDEVDVFEYYSDNKSKIYLTDHTNGGGGCTPNLSFDPTADFHTYAADVDGQNITWYIDGQKQCSAPGSPHQAASILFDMFVYSQIPPDPSVTSEMMQVDFIRAWQRGTETSSAASSASSTSTAITPTLYCLGPCTGSSSSSLSSASSDSSVSDALTPSSDPQITPTPSTSPSPCLPHQDSEKDSDDNPKGLFVLLLRFFALFLRLLFGISFSNPNSC